MKQPSLFSKQEKQAELEVLNCQIRSCENRIIGSDSVPEETIVKAMENGCKSIAYTYIEPSIYYEHMYDVALYKNLQREVATCAGYNQIIDSTGNLDRSDITGYSNIK